MFAPEEDHVRARILWADEQTVVVGRVHGGDVVGLVADTGRQRWSITLASGLRPAAAVESRYGVHVLLDRPMEGDDAPPEVLTIDPHSGAERWRAHLGGRPWVDHDLQWGAHLVVDDRLVVQTTTDIQALDTRARRIAWVVPFAVEDYETFGLQPIVVDDGTVFAGDAGGDLVAVDLDSGDVLWRRTTQEGPAPVGLSPSFFVYVDESGVHGLDQATGRRRWTRPLPEARVGLLDGAIYVAAADRVMAVSGRGSVRWDQPVEESRPSTVTLVGDVLVVAGEDGIHGFDRRDGTPQWLTIDGVAEPPHFLSDGRLLVAHTTGAIALYTLNSPTSG